MIDTKTIRTQQEIIAKRNMALPKKWILGIDAGFSSLKGFAPNKYFCFPSFAHKLDSELQVVNEKDILYRDESGTYLVGHLRRTRSVRMIQMKRKRNSMQETVMQIRNSRL